MTCRSPRLPVSVAAVALLAGALVSAQVPGTRLVRLVGEVERLSAASGGRVGVSAVNLETQSAFSINGNEPFPMASTFKVPVAVQFFHRVDEGEIRLDDMVTLGPSDLHPGSGEIGHLLNDPGVSLSLLNLVELMLLISDNSATDLVLEAAGGPAAVNTRLGELGITGIRVDRPTIRLIADWSGVTLPPEDEWTPERYRELSRAVEPGTRRAAADAFERDPRDTSTPEGMTDLLRTIWIRSALSEASTAQLLDIMRRCETGPGRIKGMLPPGTEVRHKTGTIGGTTNDVGIITLPGEAGHVALAVFVKGSRRPSADVEPVIAQIARAVYDYFLFAD
jgi:beta-lactamase class A